MASAIYFIMVYVDIYYRILPTYYHHRQKLKFYEYD